MVGTGPELQALADKVSATWANFARTGNPQTPGLPVWKPYDSTNRSTMIINTDWKLVNDPNRDDRLLLMSLPRQPIFVTGL
jgi:para-nitrobenzyl esterase